MARKLVELPKVEKQPCPATIALCQQLLARAEAGELAGIAVICCYTPSPENPVGTFGTAIVADVNKDMIGFLGMVEVLKARIIAGIDIPERDDGY